MVGPRRPGKVRKQMRIKHVILVTINVMRLYMYVGNIVCKIIDVHRKHHM